jgi:hypothetical protein
MEPKGDCLSNCKFFSFTTPADWYGTNWLCRATGERIEKPTKCELWIDRYEQAKEG